MNITPIVLLIRLIVASIVSPFVTALLAVAPEYIPVYSENRISMSMSIMNVYFYSALFVSYATSIILGLPIAFFLFKKNKCSYTAFAIIGFVLTPVNSIR